MRFYLACLCVSSSTLVAFQQDAKEGNLGFVQGDPGAPDAGTFDAKEINHAFLQGDPGAPEAGTFGARELNHHFVQADPGALGAGNSDAKERNHHSFVQADHGALGADAFNAKEMNHRFVQAAPDALGADTFYAKETKRHGFTDAGNFGADLVKNFDDQADQLYILMGDTQFWFPCTGSNGGCKAAAGCNRASRDCSTKNQNEWANKVQRISILALNKLVRAAIRGGKRGIDGLIINGDLTDFGHADEFERLQDVWGKVDDIHIYYGLGNHDYENNVNDCGNQNCASRMLHFLRDWAIRGKFKPDIRKKPGILETASYRGSLAYSWDSCDQSGASCVHFVQLHNYPSYVRKIHKFIPIEDWFITKSFRWLKTDLRNRTGTPVILNMHQYSSNFKMKDRFTLQRILANAGVNVLAIFFAHFHAQTGLKAYWCINGRAAPLLYTGSVPANNYVLLHLSGGAIKNLYHFHVKDEKSTVMGKTVLKRMLCL